jgi:hypothetical protein
MEGIVMFTKQIRQLCYERQQAELWEQNRKKQNGEYIYLNFCVWCNIYADKSKKTDPKAFAKWLKQKNIELTFWQRKNLAEKYFGYKYEYDYEKKDWEIKKLSQNT